mgnify:CR=1 FL=1
MVTRHSCGGGAKVGTAAEQLSKMDKVKEWLEAHKTLVQIGQLISTKVAPAAYDAANDAMTGATRNE